MMVTFPVNVLAVSDLDGHLLTRYQKALDTAIRFVGSAATMRDARRLLLQHATDVVVIDVHLRQDRPARVVDGLACARPDLALLAVMAAEDWEIARDVVARGVMAIVLDSASPAEMALAIRSAWAGQCTIPPVLLTPVLELLRSPGGH